MFRNVRQISHSILPLPTQQWGTAIQWEHELWAVWRVQECQSLHYHKCELCILMNSRGHLDYKHVHSHILVWFSLQAHPNHAACREAQSPTHILCFPCNLFSCHFCPLHNHGNQDLPLQSLASTSVVLSLVHVMCSILCSHMHCFRKQNAECFQL